MAEGEVRIGLNEGRAEGWLQVATIIGLFSRSGRLIDEQHGALAERESITERSVRMTLSLAQLALSIVEAIVDGRLPRGIGVRDLVDLPASWMEQERALGIV